VDYYNVDESSVPCVLVVLTVCFWFFHYFTSHMFRHWLMLYSQNDKEDPTASHIVMQRP
jgi:hypothetical protein